MVGSYTDSQGLIQNGFQHSPADPEVIRYGRDGSALDPTDRLFIDLRGSYENRAGGEGYFVNIPDSNLNDVDPVVSGTRGYGTRTISDGSALIRWSLDSVQLTAIADYNRINDHFFQDIDYTPLAGLDAGQDVFVKSKSLELRAQSTGSGPLKWLVGAYGSDIDQDVTTLLYINPCIFVDPATCPLGPVDRTAAIVAPFGINQNNNRAYATFGQVDWSITEKAALTLGIRYDRDRRRQYSVTELVTREKTFQLPQPKLSFAYRWDPALMTYGDGVARVP